jgi:hypothetical protein
MAELVIVSQAIGQGFEAANMPELLASGGHDSSQRKIERLQSLGLQNLAPEIRIDGDGFPLHRECRGIGKTIETIHETNIAGRARHSVRAVHIRRGDGVRLNPGRGKAALSALS